VRVCPELVSYGSDGKVMSVHYLNLIGMLLNELQKQVMENKDLSRENRELRSEDRELRSEVAQVREEQARTAASERPCRGPAGPAAP